MQCSHENFEAMVNVSRILADETTKAPHRWQADITIKCADCGLPMRFIGLPAGLDLNGAAVSVNGEEGRFAIAPKGHVLSEIEGGTVGFTVRKSGHRGVLRRDDDSHWYAVPVGDVEAFDALMERIEGVDYMDLPDAFDEFNNRFGACRIDSYADVEIVLP